MQIGLSEDLIEQFNAGRVDVAFARRSPGTSKGRLAWREPLVWAASDTFHVSRGAALPLAFVERSFVREAALAAAQDGELTWEIVCNGLSLFSVRAAVLAGLAIAPLPASAVHPRLAHSRCRGRPAAATRSRVRYLREGPAGEGRSGARRSSVVARARSNAPDDLILLMIKPARLWLALRLRSPQVCKGAGRAVPNAKLSDREGSRGGS
jgi:DNA-binding transcriptional LysR family regulator